MSSSFDFEAVEQFSCGTEGEPGQRVFYLQALHQGEILSLRCEKQQVALLADYLEGIVGMLEPNESHLMPELITPVFPAWVIGSIMVGLDPSDASVVVVIEELAEDSPATARLRLRSDQVWGFITGARRVVAAGRPDCTFCGRPYSPRHVCPAMN